MKINCKWEDNMNIKTIKYILDFIMLALYSFKFMLLAKSDFMIWYYVGNEIGISYAAQMGIKEISNELLPLYLINIILMVINIIFYKKGKSSKFMLISEICIITGTTLYIIYYLFSQY